MLLRLLVVVVFCVGLVACGDDDGGVSGFGGSASGSGGSGSGGGGTGGSGGSAGFGGFGAVGGVGGTLDDAGLLDASPGLDAAMIGDAAPVDAAVGDAVATDADLSDATSDATPDTSVEDAGSDAAVDAGGADAGDAATDASDDDAGGVVADGGADAGDPGDGRGCFGGETCQTFIGNLNACGTTGVLFPPTCSTPTAPCGPSGGTCIDVQAVGSFCLKACTAN